MSKISVFQIDAAQLTLFVQQAASGAAFSGNAVAYAAGSGWMGPTVLWVTGGTQNVLGAKSFASAITVPYVGLTGQTVARLYVDNSISAVSGVVNTSILNVSGVLQAQLGAAGLGTGFSGYAENSYVHRFANEAITGIKTFVSSPLAPTPTTTGQVANVLYVNTVSGALQAQIGGGGAGLIGAVVYQSGDQLISGLKTFTGAVTVGAPTATGHAVTLAYLTGVSGVLAAGGGGGGGAPNSVTTTGTYTMSGSYTFTGSPLVPTPVATSGAANLFYVTGISGALRTLIAAGTVTNFNITGTGTINNTFNASGSITNTFNVSGNVNNFYSGQLKVTGGSVIAVPDFTGIGGAIVYTVGSQVFVSGGAGGSATAGTTTLTRWTARDNQPPALGFATFDTNNSVAVLNFDAVTGETGVFVSTIPQGAVLTNGIDTRIYFRAAGGITGAVVWNVAFLSGNSNIGLDNWGTGIDSSGAFANGTLGFQTIATVTHLGAQIGGLQAGDFLRVKVCRSAFLTGDNMTGDAQLTAIELRQR